MAKRAHRSEENEEVTTARGIPTIRIPQLRRIPLDNGPSPTERHVHTYHCLPSKPSHPGAHPDFRTLLDLAAYVGLGQYATSVIIYVATE